MTSTQLRSRCVRFATLAFCLLALCAAPARAQITPSADAYTNAASAGTNYGAQKLLNVDNPSQITYIQFDLSSIPEGYTSSNIAKATLKLYVNTVVTAGSFNVDYVNGSWSEGSITADLAPALGTTIVASVPLAKSQLHDYILIDITPAVGAWLDGTQPNDGLALVGNSPFNATFDSKENTTNSHPPELDIVFAVGGGSGITSINTSSSSGLQGGGSSGTLNLSMITSCASGQILQWNASAWKCANVGTGTITGVTAGTDLTGGGTGGTVTLNVDTTKVVTSVVAGTDLTGGGTGGAQTLSLDTTKVPQLSAANTFTGNQTINGNLSATGIVTGTRFQIGSNLFAWGDSLGGNTSIGFAGNTGDQNLLTTAVGVRALRVINTGSNDTAVGTDSLQATTTGTNDTATGYAALYSNTTGSQNTATGNVALQENTTGGYNTAIGFESLVNNTTASYNTAVGYLSGPDTSHANQTNSTAIGAFADVTASNSLVLGSINGVNTATADTNVGIGTTAPASTLDVEANMPARSAPIFLLKNNAAIQSGTNGNAIDLRFAPDGGSSVGNPNAYIRVQEDGNTQYGAFMSFATMADGGAGSGAIERIRITASGNVGIGVSSPTHIFQVGQGLGAAFADSWSTYSSRRWKTNIHTLPDALAKVEQLRGVSYDLKGNGKHEIGVIAEEVGLILPEIVSYGENGKDALGVDYSRLTALLIEATKEQQTLIRQQQKQIAAQQAQITRLASQVQTINATIRTKMKTGVASKVRLIQPPASTIHQ